MTSLNLTLDLKLEFVTLIPKQKVHRITFLILDSALRSLLVSWTSEVVVLVGDPSSDTEVECLVVVDTYIHQACTSSRKYLARTMSWGPVPVDSRKSRNGERWPVRPVRKNDRKRQDDKWSP
jgi:hypothetical protein